MTIRISVVREGESSRLRVDGLLFHLQLHSAWLVAGGAAVGLAGSLLR